MCLSLSAAVEFIGRHCESVLAGLKKAATTANFGLEETLSQAAEGFATIAQLRLVPTLLDKSLYLPTPLTVVCVQSLSLSLALSLSPSLSLPLSLSLSLSLSLCVCKQTPSPEHAPTEMSPFILPNHPTFIR